MAEITVGPGRADDERGVWLGRLLLLAVERPSFLRVLLLPGVLVARPVASFRRRLTARCKSKTHFWIIIQWNLHWKVTILGNHLHFTAKDLVFRSTNTHYIYHCCMDNPVTSKHVKPLQDSFILVGAWLRKYVHYAWKHTISQFYPPI